MKERESDPQLLILILCPNAERSFQKLQDINYSADIYLPQMVLQILFTAKEF